MLWILAGFVCGAVVGFSSGGPVRDALAYGQGKAAGRADAAAGVPPDLIERVAGWLGQPKSLAADRWPAYDLPQTPPSPPTIPPAPPIELFVGPAAPPRVSPWAG